jgi:cell division protein FtsL
MATQPRFFRRTEAPAPAGAPPDAERRPTPVRTERDPFQLRALPHEDVFFYCKKIDNSRLVREPDPQSRGACWSAIGAACVVLALLTGVLAPSVANTLAGYKLENLRAEERQLLDERRTLELQEAELLSPERLEKLAKGQNLVTPSSAQVVHLDGNKPDGAVAMVK